MSQLEGFARSTSDREDREIKRADLQVKIALLSMYEGQFQEADRWLERAIAENPGLPASLKANLGALRGVAALRRGEVENCVACVGPSSCIFPISPDARHVQTAGSRAAIGHFTDYLQQRPDDVGVRWLLAIAAMSLGEYPAGVPPAYQLPPDLFASTLDPRPRPLCQHRSSRGAR